jgi:TRAP-type C4-dicarboxylate transport system permease small subunit
MTTIGWLTTLVKRLVGWMVALLLGWMVLLAATQLILRWTASTSFPWADLQLRQLVLWIGLLGGVLAAADGRHIRIDLVEHYCNPQIKIVISRLIALLSAAGSLLLTYLSFGFIQGERNARVLLDGVFFGSTIGQWIAELIIPFGFSLMSLYFIFAAALPLKKPPVGDLG